MAEEFIFNTNNHRHIFIMIASHSREAILTLSFKTDVRPGLVVTVPSINYVTIKNLNDAAIIARDYIKTEFDMKLNENSFVPLSRKLYENLNKAGDIEASEHIYLGFTNIERSVFQTPESLKYNNNFIGMKWRTFSELNEIFHNKKEGTFIQAGLKEVSERFLKSDESGLYYPGNDAPKEVDRRDIRSVNRLQEY